MGWLIALVVTTVAIPQSDNWPASPLQKANKTLKRKNILNIYLFVDLAKHPDRHSYYVSSIG